MKIKSNEIKQLVKEAYEKQIKIKTLTENAEKIKEEIKTLNEDDFYNSSSTAGGANSYTSTSTAAVQKDESIFNAKPGNIIIFNFQGATIKVKRQVDDIFKVIDATESAKLKDGDYVQVQGNDILTPGRTLTFNIFRPTGLKYQSNQLNSWTIVKN